MTSPQHNFKPEDYTSIREISGTIIDVVNRTMFGGTLLIRNGLIEDIARNDSIHGPFILPGFVDAHVHTESSMMPPSEFARLAVPHGTVATVSDPHEIANVLGLAGIHYMIDNGNTVPFTFHFGAPPCVPATSMETAGAEITAADIEPLFKSGGLRYLSEMMNFPDVIKGDPRCMEKIALAKKYGLPIDGHAPGITGEALTTYVKAGISTDHEIFSIGEGLEKLSLGMKVLIREGSAAKNFESLHSLIDSHYGMCMFCADDKHPDDLACGHIDELVKRSLACGHDLWKVLHVASVNPVRHYGLRVGLLQKGEDADFIVVDSLESFNILQTVIKGYEVAREGQSLVRRPDTKALNNFHVRQKHIDDFAVEKQGNYIHVIDTQDGQLITGTSFLLAKIEDEQAVIDLERDMLKIAVVNRYHEAPPSIGFIRNFGLKRGAIAASVAHDSHNIIAVGASDESLCRAVNAIVSSKGGLALIDGTREMLIPLPMAGLMSLADGYTTASEYSKIDRMAKELGATLSAPYMTLSFMALPVIPEIKMTDRSLFDVTRFRPIELFV